jgi:RNA 3'-terminal phosphate cyclase (ATP)
VRIEPTLAPRAVQIHERDPVLRRTAQVVLAKLPFDIALRELAVVRATLGWDADPRDVIKVESSLSAGNAVTLSLEGERSSECFCAIGEHRKSAEAVAHEAINQVREVLAASVPVGTYLADQLMVPFAIATARGAGACSFTTTALSRHSTTNSEIVGTFLGRTPCIEPLDNRSVRWTIT